MTKEKLSTILDVIPDNSDIEITFSFNDVFASSYDCTLTGLNVSYGGDNEIKAVLLLSEKKTEEEEPVYAPDEVPVTAAEAEPGEYNVA